jgi:acetyl esterase/lipase
VSSRSLALGLFTASALGVPAPAQPSDLPPVEPRIVPLWPDGSPHNPAEGPRPTLEIYRTFTDGRTAGATAVILPGGGYSTLSPFHRLMAEWFRAQGYDAVVVNYRVKPHRYPAPFADALRAMRLVRHRGPEWGLATGKVLLYGGSAGGHLASLVATRPDLHRDPHDDLAGRVPARPDRLILLYPVVSASAAYRHASFNNWFDPAAPDSIHHEVSPEKHVTAANPPTILFHAADDRNVVVSNSVDFARACWSAGVPAELHVYPRGGHGREFSFDPQLSPRWRETLRQWLSLP